MPLTDRIIQVRFDFNVVLRSLDEEFYEIIRQNVSLKECQRYDFLSSTYGCLLQYNRIEIEVLLVRIKVISLKYRGLLYVFIRFHISAFQENLEMKLNLHIFSVKGKIPCLVHYGTSCIQDKNDYVNILMHFVSYEF